MKQSTQSVASLIKAHKAASKVETAQRNAATTILSPDDVAGEYDATVRGLTTTVDGAHRAITYEDLKRFKGKIAGVRAKLTKAGHKGGITPKSIITMSLKIDRERAQKEITTAAPLRKDGSGLVVFRTNASAQSSDSHHLVHVRFMNFGAALAAGQVDNKLVLALTSGRVKFDCDCGRHRYWYRFIASAGGFNEGRAEGGFPKIRNPNLKGLACKHVLRVMTQISQSPNFKAFAKQWIGTYRQDVSTKTSNVNAKDAKAFEKAVKSESWKQRQVRPSAAKVKPNSPNKPQATTTTASGKKLKLIDLAKQKAAKLANDTSERARNKYISDLKGALAMGAISQSTYEMAMKNYA